MHNPIAYLLPLLILILVSTPGLAEVMGITENATTQAFADAGFQVNNGKMGQETKVGPIWSEIVYDRAIKFNP